jgi:hypothetical protein
MLITFHTDAFADITLFGEVGLSFLKMMGHSGTVPGAILAADVPAALAGLRAGAGAVAPVAETDADDPPVSMSKRALPLIQLLEAAIAAKADVMWD